MNLIKVIMNKKEILLQGRRVFLIKKMILEEDQILKKVIVTIVTSRLDLDREDKAEEEVVMLVLSMFQKM